jgi:hypothetical protein
MKRILAISLLLCGCRADFHPYGDDTETGEGTTGPDAGTDDTGGETTGSGSTDPTDDTGSTGSTDDTGTDDTGTDDTGSTDETGGPEPESAAPDEPCDPFLGEDYGVAPCAAPDGDPFMYTCTYVALMPVPNVWTVELRCARMYDTEGDGSDIGDYCNDGGAPPYFPGCMDSYCKVNGHPDVYPLNFAQGECSPGADGEDRCCVPYCDAEHPCDGGKECDYSHDNGESGVGACIVP